MRGLHRRRRHWLLSNKQQKSKTKFFVSALGLCVFIGRKYEDVRDLLLFYTDIWCMYTCILRRINCRHALKHMADKIIDNSYSNESVRPPADTTKYVVRTK